MIHIGDCLEILPTLEENSVDAVITDPPYELGFMGKGWDKAGVSFDPATWSAILRVAKPGAHLLAFGGTRTFHRLAVAIEDARWEIRDTIMWVYGSGFPKSLNVSKAIDKDAGATREVLGKHQFADRTFSRTTAVMGQYGRYNPASGNPLVTAPATEAAKKWDGWGTALKPAWEPIIVARKPLVGTVAENILQYGTGGMNIDGCRIEISDGDQKGEFGPHKRGLGEECAENGIYNKGWKRQEHDQSHGRWPANLIHDGSNEVVGLFPVTTSGRLEPHHAPDRKKNGAIYGKFSGLHQPPQPFGGDKGTAARFFYCAKASKADRETGNNHPTVKPIALMCYLCRLVTPPGGMILDPFMGSGSTGKAAEIEGFEFIGIELNSKYVMISEVRIDSAILPLFRDV